MKTDFPFSKQKHLCMKARLPAVLRALLLRAALVAQVVWELYENVISAVQKWNTATNVATGN